MDFIEPIEDVLQSVFRETWNWFNSLNQEEWIALLAVVAALGFLCMRGFSNRSNI